MYKSKKPYFYGTGRRKSSVARVRLYPQRHRHDHHQRPRHRRLLRPGDPEAALSASPWPLTGTVGKVDIVCHRLRRRRHRPGRRHPPRRGPRPAAGRRRVPRRPEGRRFPHPRPSYEGAQEVRPQGCPSCASVLQEITGPTNQFKNAQKARNHAVFGAFSFSDCLPCFGIV